MSKYDLERQFKEDTYTLGAALNPSECKQPNWIEALQQEMDNGTRTMRVMDSSAGLSKLSGPDTWKTPEMQFEIRTLLATSVPKANPGITINTERARPEYNPSDIGTCDSRVDVSKCDVILTGDGMHSWQVVPAAQAGETIARHQRDLMRLDRMLQVSSFLARMNFQVGGNSEMTMAARHMFGDNGLYSAEPRNGQMGAFDVLAKQLLDLPVNVYALEAIMNGEDRYRQAYAYASQHYPNNPAYVQAYAVHESLTTIQLALRDSNPQVDDELQQMCAKAYGDMTYCRYERDDTPAVDDHNQGDDDVGDSFGEDPR